MPYEWQSGLVFDETVVSTKSKHWDFCMEDFMVKKGRKKLSSASRDGAPALYDTATRVLLRHLNSVDPGVLKALPDRMLNHLWRAAAYLPAAHFQLWKLFAANKDSRSRHPKSVMAGCSKCDQMDLGRILPHINSPSLSWITHLSLESVRFSTPEMMKLVDLTNLRTLYIRATKKDESLPLHQIIRAWALSAKEQKAFSILKMIFLDITSPLSPWTFHNINAFPALDTLAMRAPERVDVRKMRWYSEDYGWREDQGSQFLTYARQWYRSRWREGVTRVYCNELVTDFFASHERPAGLDELPTLNVRCGLHDAQSFRHDELLCFERDRETQNRQAEWSAASENPHDRPAPKKRKIKEGKESTLNDFLAGL